jgi:hypothetical protein
MEYLFFQNALLLLLGSPGSQSDKLPGLSEPPVISDNNQDLLDLLGMKFQHTPCGKLVDIFD